MLLEVTFKIGPTALIGILNAHIILIYKRTCKKRRKMRRCKKEKTKSFVKERTLTLLLSSTSLLFLFCISPMVILQITLNEDNLSRFSYQVCIFHVGIFLELFKLYHSFYFNHFTCSFFEQ